MSFLKGCRSGAFLRLPGCRSLPAMPKRVDHKIGAVSVQLALKRSSVLGDPARANEVGSGAPSGAFGDITELADPGDFHGAGTSDFSLSVEGETAKQVGDDRLNQSRSIGTCEGLKHLARHRNEATPSPTPQEIAKLVAAIVRQLDRTLAKDHEVCGSKFGQLSGNRFFGLSQQCSNLRAKKTPLSFLCSRRSLRGLANCDEFQASYVGSKRSKRNRSSVECG